MKSLRPFNSAVRRTQLQAVHRALGNDFDEFDYLRQVAGTNLLDRVADLSVKFKDVVDLGAHSGVLARAIQAGAHSQAKGFMELSSFTQVCTCDAQAELARNVHFPTSTNHQVHMVDDLADLSLPDNSADLIISSMALHWVNDLPSTLKQVQRILRPEGCFIAIMLGGDTLHELNAAMSIAEQERDGGLSSHISPMLRVADACGLLSGAGLKLITVDAQQMQVEFDNAFACMRNLWYLGESHSINSRRPHVSKHTMMATAAAMQYLFGAPDGSVPVTFELVCMIGWKEGLGLVKPLEPGSTGHISLAELGKGYSG